MHKVQRICHSKEAKSKNKKPLDNSQWKVMLKKRVIAKKWDKLATNQQDWHFQWEEQVKQNPLTTTRIQPKENLIS